jgi:hypothetical protein
MKKATLIIIIIILIPIVITITIYLGEKKTQKYSYYNKNY